MFWYPPQKRQHIGKCAANFHSIIRAGRETLFVDIKLEVPPQYKLLMLKCKSYCNVNKRQSSTRWTTRPYTYAYENRCWVALLRKSLLGCFACLVKRVHELWSRSTKRAWGQDRDRDLLAPQDRSSQIGMFFQYFHQFCVQFDWDFLKHPEV